MSLGAVGHSAQNSNESELKQGRGGQERRGHIQRVFSTQNGRDRIWASGGRLQKKPG